MSFDESEKWERAIDANVAVSRNYKLTFGVPWGKEVLRDLANFCFANRTTAVHDVNHMLIYEGRRQVFVMIQRFLNLTAADIERLTHGDDIKIEASE